MQRTNEAQGWFWGFWGVVGFSLTLPATQVAVPFFGPTVTGIGRAVLAGAMAAILLWVRREPFPRKHVGGLLVVIAGGILGFPWLTAWAMARVPATHGAVMLALLPLMTAGAGALLSRERPSARFWIASVVGSGSIIAYALLSGAGGWQPADAALVGAVVIAALGYNAGGTLARQLGGWRVVSWGLVLALPVTLTLTLFQLHTVRWAAVPPSAWAGFVYVALGSQMLSFFAWYHGLAKGGIMRVSQLQYLQVFMTFGWSAWLLGEHVTAMTAVAAVLVVIAVAWGRSAPIRTAGARGGVR